MRKDEMPGIGVIPFDAPLLHPWRKPVIAALLGLTAQELSKVVAEHDGSALLESTMSALVDPERSLLLRIERTTDPTERQRLASGLEDLRPIMHGTLDIDDLWMSRLCLLPTRLLPDAHPLGSAELLASPLTSHYRLVATAAEQMTRAVEAGEPLLVPLTWIRLQRAVDDLFGLPASPERGTLAELWRRIWPSTAPAETAIAVPGLFRDCSSRMLEAWHGARVFGSPIPDDMIADEVIARGILGDGCVTQLPAPGIPDFRATTARLDQERRAWSWLTRRSLTQLAAVCLGIDADPRVGAWIRPQIPEPLADSRDLGRVVLRALLEGLAPPHGQPSVVVQLLRGKKPTDLAMDRLEATAFVMERLTAALGVQNPGTDFATRALSTVLSGFWTGSRCERAPTGWVWSPDGTELPSGFRRAVPRLCDDAWTIWPGYLLLTDPVECAASGRWNEALTPGHLAWLGLEIPPPADPWWDAQPVEHPAETVEQSPEQSANHTPPIPVLPLAPPELVAEPVTILQAVDAEVRVMADPVPEWIARWSRRKA